jgi:hypothetical protein
MNTLQCFHGAFGPFLCIINTAPATSSRAGRNKADTQQPTLLCTPLSILLLLLLAVCMLMLLMLVHTDIRVQLCSLLVGGAGAAAATAE